MPEDPVNWSWEVFFAYLTNGMMLRGAWTTVWLSVVSMILGLGLGVVAAMMKMYGGRALRWTAEFYIWLFRGTPILIQLVIIYTGLPQIGIRLTVIESAILGLALNEGAYLAEVMRSGIMSVDKGQTDASRAIGMTWRQRMWLVILPQATRTIIPPLGNQFNGMLKTTSLASVISMEELMRSAQMLAQIEFRVLESYVVAAVWYLILVSIWGMIQVRIEAHYEKPFGPAAAVSPDARKELDRAARASGAA
jgi:polar amino acid transport system permease protein